MRKLWIGIIIVVFVTCLIMIGAYLNQTRKHTPPSMRDEYLPKIVYSQTYEFVDASGNLLVNYSLDDDELLIRRYLNTWLDPNPEMMRSYAADSATYDSLTASGLPYRLLSYAIDDKDTLPKTKPSLTKYTAFINDGDGNTKHLAFKIEKGRVTEVVEIQSTLRPTKKGTPLTRQDRIQIIDLLSDTNMPRDDFYIDFYDMVSYKNYTKVGSGNAWAGVNVYLKKTERGWNVVMETQDIVFKKELDKLGVPEDVQKEVWDKVYANQEEWEEECRSL